MELAQIRGSHQGAALMKRMIKYVGLDVHQATTVVSVRDGSGRVILRCVLPTEDAGLLEFFGLMRGAVHVAFEEGPRRSGCTTCCFRWSNASSCATAAARPVGATRATRSTPMSSRAYSGAAISAPSTMGAMSGRRSASSRALPGAGDPHAWHAPLLTGLAPRVAGQAEGPGRALPSRDALH